MSKVNDLRPQLQPMLQQQRQQQQQRRQKRQQQHLAEKEDKIESFVNKQLAAGIVPRLSDIYEHLRSSKITKPLIRKVLLKRVEFQNVLPQQRPPGSSRQRRMISTPSLGYYHGDIGFFSTHSRYPTPKKYRSGFLVLIDVLSRFVLLEVLPFNRTSATMIKIFEQLMQRHKQQHTFPMRGVSFDQEKSIMSKPVQSFLKLHHITFRDFMYSASKSKLAENTIGRLRSIMHVLELQTKKTWWKLLPQVESIFNNQPLEYYGQRLPPQWTPKSITKKNLPEFLQLVQQKQPAFYYSHFELNPSFVSFLFNLNDRVKVKTKIMSSQVLGPKRKITQLSEETFLIVQRKAYARFDMSIGKCYTVIPESMTSNKTAAAAAAAVVVAVDANSRLHVFEEEELVAV